LPWALQLAKIARAAPYQFHLKFYIDRLLCTSPTMIVAMVHQPSFIHLDPIDIGTGKFLSNEWEKVPYGVCRLIQDQRANACYKLKRTLHVGEELKFDLEAGSIHKVSIIGTFIIHRKTDI
jgi:hypothetical protein